jgi:hypothetical protein
LEGKSSLNPYIGGDSWQPYIGNLEIGLWLFTFVDNGSSPELENLATAEQKKHRHTGRISNIVRYLQDKLTRFPKHDDASEFESFVGSLRQEAMKLSAEPNGKKLLSFLGEIYVSKAQAHLNKFSTSATLIKHSSLFNNFRFVVSLVTGFLAVRNKSGQGMNQTEVKVCLIFSTEIKLIMLIKFKNNLRLAK